MGAAFARACLIAGGLGLLLAACERESGTSAPPRETTPAALPVQTSTLVVPLSVDLAMIERVMNRDTPGRLWSIDKKVDKCVPAQRLTVCLKHERPCKGDACKEVPCKVGFKRAKITPDLSCRIVGEVTRGRIAIGGSGNRITLRMPISATVSARNVGGIIKKETATAAAIVRAGVQVSIARDWSTVAKISLDYDWTEPPGIDFLGQRIKFARRADKELAGVLTDLERKLASELGKAQTRALISGVWRKGFTSIELNRDKPPAWMRITPQRLGLASYQVKGKTLEFVLSAEAITETFIGQRPPDPAVTPLPPQAGPMGARGLRFHIPVLADYTQLEPVLLRALRKLDAKGITIKDVGQLKVDFRNVTIYPTLNGRIAVGVDAKADVLGNRLDGTSGEVWLTGIPYNDDNSRLVRVRDLKMTSRTDRQAVDLLIRLFAEEAVLEEIRAGLTTDFTKDYDKVMKAAQKAIASRREGDFILSARIRNVSHGSVVPTAQGLFLPVSVVGDGSIVFAPQRRKR
jgi:hypothetical protein